MSYIMNPRVQHILDCFRGLYEEEEPIERITMDCDLTEGSDPNTCVLITLETTGKKKKEIQRLTDGLSLVALMHPLMGNKLLFDPKALEMEGVMKMFYERNLISRIHIEIPEDKAVIMASDGKNIEVDFGDDHSSAIRETFTVIESMVE